MECIFSSSFLKGAIPSLLVLCVSIFLFIKTVIKEIKFYEDWNRSFPHSKSKMDKSKFFLDLFDYYLLWIICIGFTIMFYSFCNENL